MPANTFGPGYDAGFLARKVPAPTPGRWTDDLVEASGSKVLTYTHYSVALSASRRLPRWAAWNIDGTSLYADGDTAIPRTGLGFRADPRVDRDLQTLAPVYARNRLDNGHIARRGDLVWGDRKEAEQANYDSFYFTNICPQMDSFNQSTKDGVWGLLENAVLEQAHLDDKRVSVFAGPVLRDSDPAYRTTQVPREFWKVIAYVVDGTLRSRSFVVTQSLHGLRDLDPLAEFRTFAVSPAEIESRTGLGLPAAVERAAQTAGRSSRELDGPHELRGPDDLSW